MLQQTQVATVIPYFVRFTARFPTIQALATARPQSVLRQWQGLGYYSRARNLHAAARKIVAEHNGEIPTDFDALLALPGVGRYTAGAIASIAFDRQRPILDGNVARVLCRLGKIESDPRLPKVNEQLWQKAAEILPAKRAGDFNSALMELGATVCTPRNPRCENCPVKQACGALSAGAVERIPVRKKSHPTPLVKRFTFAVQCGEHWLIERRPPRGRWAGLWQFVTIEAGTDEPDDLSATAAIGFPVTELRPVGQVTHALTHRRYVFTAFSCVATGDAANLNGSARRWVRLTDLSRYPFSKPQLLIANRLAAALQSRAT
jgi:A/G-specific adenine glycosylase